MGDLIPVRADEAFDVARLVEWMKDQPDLPTGIPTVEQYAGGKANLTYLLTFPDGVRAGPSAPTSGPGGAGCP